MWRDFHCGTFADLDKLDNEKREMNQTDIAALHHFYSKHLDFPDDDTLIELFAQVRVWCGFMMSLLIVLQWTGIPWTLPALGSSLLGIGSAYMPPSAPLAN